MANQKRILELALTGLKVEQARIQQEISEITHQLNGTSTGNVAPGAKAPARNRRRRYTAAQKQLASERMKVYWAKKRKAAKA